MVVAAAAGSGSGSGNDVSAYLEPLSIDWPAAAAPNPVPALQQLLPDPAPSPQSPLPPALEIQSPRSPGPASESPSEPVPPLTQPRRISLLVSPRPKHEHSDAKGSRSPPKPVDYNGMQIVVPLDNWLCGALATPCPGCGSMNTMVTNENIRIEGIAVTLTMKCEGCGSTIGQSNQARRRLFPIRSPGEEDRLTKQRVPRRRAQRVRRGWQPEQIAAAEADPSETSAPMRERRGNGFLECNVRRSAATLLSGMTATQQQEECEFTSQLPLPRRTITRHAPYVWFAATRVAHEECVKLVLSHRDRPKLRVLIDGAWDHKRDGSNSELAILDADTGKPYLVISLSKDCYGKGLLTRAGNYHKNHSNGMEGAAWMVTHNSTLRMHRILFIVFVYYIILYWVSYVGVGWLSNLVVMCGLFW